MEKEKIIVSVQVPQDIFNKLKEIADAECTSVSYLIRKAILKEINGGKTKGGKKNG